MTGPEERGLRDEDLWSLAWQQGFDAHAHWVRVRDDAFALRKEVSRVLGEHLSYVAEGRVAPDKDREDALCDAMDQAAEKHMHLMEHPPENPYDAPITPST